MADNLDPDITRQLNESMRGMQETIAGMIPSMILQTAVINETVKALKGEEVVTTEATNVVKEYIKAQTESTKAEKDKAEAAKEKSKEENRQKNVIKKLQEDSEKTFKSLQSAITSTSTGMSKYTGITGTAASAAAGLYPAFKALKSLAGPINMVAVGAKALSSAFSLFLSAFGTAVDLVLKQNDAYLKATDDIAQFGATGSITTEQIGKMGRAAGYASQNLEKWTKITRSLGTDIIALGTTVSNGVKVFGELTKMDEEQLAIYRALGVSQEQLNQNQADYIKLQTRSGQQITQRMLQDSSLRKASLAYTDNLLTLSALSGMEIEDIKKKQEINRADISFQIAIAAKDKERIELLEKFNATGNKEYLTRAKTLEGEIARQKMLQDVAITMGLSAEEMAGINQSIALEGKAITELNSRFANASNNVGESLQDFVAGVVAGTRDAKMLPKFFQEATDKWMGGIKTAVILGREETGNAFGQSTALIINAGKQRGKTEKQISEDLDKEFKRRKRMGKIDPRQELRNLEEQTRRRMQLAADELVDMISGPINTGFKLLLEMVDNLAESIARTVDWFNATFLNKKTNFAERFASPAELQTKVDELSKTIESLNQQERKEIESRKDNLKINENLAKKEQELQEAKNKQIELGKNRPGSNATPDEIKAYQQERIDTAKKVSALTDEVTTLKVKQRQGQQAGGMDEAGKAKITDIQKRRTEATKEKIGVEKRLEERRVQTGQATKSEVKQEGAKRAEESTHGNEARGGKKSTTPGVHTSPFDSLNDLFDFTARSGSRESFEQLDSAFKEKLIDAAKNYLEATGKKITVESAKRTTQEQQELWDKAKPTDNPDVRIQSNGMPVAKPGNSAHELGKAVDIRNYEDSELVKAMNYEGLIQKVKGDKPHFEQARYGGMFSGPTTGYPVMLHGDEAVVPMNKTVSKSGDFTGLSKMFEQVMIKSFKTKDMGKIISEKIVEELDNLSDKLNDRDTGKSKSKLGDILVDKLTKLTDNLTKETGPTGFKTLAGRRSIVNVDPQQPSTFDTPDAPTQTQPIGRTFPKFGEMNVISDPRGRVETINDKVRDFNENDLTQKIKAVVAEDTKKAEAKKQPEPTPPPKIPEIVAEQPERITAPDGMVIMLADKFDIMNDKMSSMVDSLDAIKKHVRM